LLCKVFRENKKLNLELESAFSEIASLRSVHDDMSAKPCDNCTTIMVNYPDLWLMHSQVASQLKGVKLELRELKACSLLLGVCTSCPLAIVFYPLRARCMVLSRVSFLCYQRE
jgi:hypothetical protein